MAAFDPNLSHSGLDRLGNIEQYLISIQSQLLNANLTAIGALNPSTANVIASDGSGWIGKTYAQLKTALGLTSADVGLGNVTNDAQMKRLTPTAIKTTNYTASPGDLVVVDTTSGNVTVTLPNAPADATVVAVKQVVQGGANTVTVNCAGSDVFNTTGGVTTKTLSLLSQAILLQYKASGAIWYVLSDDLPLSQLDGRYQPLTSVTDGNTTVSAPPQFEFPGRTVSNDGGKAKITLGQIVFVPPPTGVAATDTAAIQAAHDALPSGGGMVQLCPGTYVLDPTSGTALTFTKQIYLKGCGYYTTLLQIDSATATAISSAASYCTFEDFCIQNVHATTPTAGSGILVGTTGGGTENQYNRIWIYGCYYGLNQQYGSGWNLTNSRLWQYTRGVYIENIDNTDGGDMTIQGCYFLSDLAVAHFGVEWQSGGGLRFENNKINSDTANGTGHIGVLCSPPTGVTTSVILIVGNSIEGLDFCVDVNTGGGILRKIVITGNEMMPTSGGTSCYIFPSSTGKIYAIVASDNVFSHGAYGIVAENVDNVKFGSNIYDSVTTPIGSVTGSTNVVALDPYPQGYEFDYAQITASVNITATTEGTATTCITGNAVTYDGATSVMVEVFAPDINTDTAAAGDQVIVCLYDNGSSIGEMYVLRTPSITAQGGWGMLARRKMTPSNAAHTYSVRAFTGSTTGTPKFGAGAGGSGALMPAYIRITKA